MVSAPFSLFVFFALFLSGNFAYAATTDQCIALRAAGYKGPCTAALLIGPTEEALLELNKGKESVYAFLAEHKAKGANTERLDPEFAKAIKAFMEDTYKETGHMPTITDGYRGAAAQDRAARSGASGVGAGGSPHNYGMAADFNGGEPKEVIRWMRAYAGSTRSDQTANRNIRTIGDPETGCDLTAANGRSFCDPNHFELATWRSTSGARPSRSYPSNQDQGLLSTIMNKLRQQQPPFAPPTLASMQPIGLAPQQILGSVFGPPSTPVLSSSPVASSGTSPPTLPPQKTPEEKIAKITVVAPSATPTSKTRPLENDNIAYLTEKKVALKPSDQKQPPTIYYPDRQGIEAVVGFSSERPIFPSSLKGTPSTFQNAYRQILSRIERALREILRIIRGEPPVQYYPEEQWTRYN